MSNHFNQVSQLLHAASGLRLLAKNPSTTEQGKKLKFRADAIETMANELAVKVGAKHRYSSEAIESEVARERRIANDFYVGANADDLPLIVQSFMTEVKKVESSNKGQNTEIIAAYLNKLSW